MARWLFCGKVIDGACDSSYGIQVAKMAGVPDPVIGRAWEILGELEKTGTVGIGLHRALPPGGARMARWARTRQVAPQVDLFSSLRLRKKSWSRTLAPRDLRCPRWTWT